MRNKTEKKGQEARKGKGSEMPENEGKHNDQLDLDDLDEAAGGCIFDADGCYEVIDNQGNVVERFPYEKGYRADRMIAQRAAEKAAGKRGFSQVELNWTQLQYRRTGIWS